MRDEPFDGVMIPAIHRPQFSFHNLDGELVQFLLRQLLLSPEIAPPHHLVRSGARVADEPAVPERKVETLPVTVAEAWNSG
jgi:hypothetical protein